MARKSKNNKAGAARRISSAAGKSAAQVESDADAAAANAIVDEPAKSAAASTTAEELEDEQVHKEADDVPRVERSEAFDVNVVAGHEEEGLVGSTAGDRDTGHEEPLEEENHASSTAQRNGESTTTRLSDDLESVALPNKDVVSNPRELPSSNGIGRIDIPAEESAADDYDADLSTNPATRSDAADQGSTSRRRSLNGPDGVSSIQHQEEDGQNTLSKEHESGPKDVAVRHADPSAHQPPDQQGVSAAQERPAPPRNELDGFATDGGDLSLRDTNDHVDKHELSRDANASDDEEATDDSNGEVASPAAAQKEEGGQDEGDIGTYAYADEPTFNPAAGLSLEEVALSTEEGEEGDVGTYAEPAFNQEAGLANSETHIVSNAIDPAERSTTEQEASALPADGLEESADTAPDVASASEHSRASSERDDRDAGDRGSIAKSPAVTVSASNAANDIRSTNENIEPNHNDAQDAPSATASSDPPPPTAPPTHIASAGPSLLSQVISQTRPTHLPPKSREEDQAHLESWKRLMEDSKAAEARKAQRAEQRRREREERLEKSLPAWAAVVDEMNQDKAGIIDWRQRCEREEKLRVLWEDGVPSHLRGKVWSVCIGNGLAMSRDSFRHCLARARKAIAEKRFPVDALNAIEHDRTSTLPITKLFVEGSPLADDLGDVLLAWVVSRSEEGLGYSSLVAPLAAMLLVNMDPASTFTSLRNLLERPLLRAFFRDEKGDIEAYYRVLEGLCSEAYPKVFSNCYQLGVRLPESYFTSLFLHQLSLESCAHVWDTLLLQDDGYVFRVILAIIGVLEPRLYFPDRQEIASIFEGHNPATMAIVERERERAKQKGLSYVSETDGALTDLGVNDASIFDVLHHDQWKEGRYRRLLERELPD